MLLKESSIDMSKLIYGERIGRNATLRPGSSASNLYLWMLLAKV